MELTKREQLEKAFTSLLEKHTYLNSWDIGPLVEKLIKEVTIRTNIKNKGGNKNGL